MKMSVGHTVERFILEERDVEAAAAGTRSFLTHINVIVSSKVLDVSS